MVAGSLTYTSLLALVPVFAVTITLTASNPQTAPAGGYSITQLGGTSTNTIIISGNNNTINNGKRNVHNVAKKQQEIRHSNNSFEALNSYKSHQ